MEDDYFIDYRQGKLLLVNKPLNWTSFDVVNKIKYALNFGLPKGQRIKIGHAGTLDPLATGLLIIATGKFTKKLAELQGLNKTYEGTIQIGGTTPSYDLETEVDEKFDYASVTEEEMLSAAKSLTGPIEQIPPIFSAIRIDGERAYKKARRNEVDKLPDPRKVTIGKFELSNIAIPNTDFEIECTKGTYIRSMAYDFGKALNNGAHLTRLVRTKVGDFDLSNAQELDTIISSIKALHDANSN